MYLLAAIPFFFPSVLRVLRLSSLRVALTVFAVPPAQPKPRDFPGAPCVVRGLVGMGCSARNGGASVTALEGYAAVSLVRGEPAAPMCVWSEESRLPDVSLVRGEPALSVISLWR